VSVPDGLGGVDRAGVLVVALGATGLRFAAGVRRFAGSASL
jgi:hypothetical protein